MARDPERGRTNTRNWRDRRRRGAVRVVIELSPARLAYLAKAGYLESAAKVTPKTATLAIEAFLADHLPT